MSKELLKELIHDFEWKRRQYNTILKRYHDLKFQTEAIPRQTNVALDDGEDHQYRSRIRWLRWDLERLHTQIKLIKPAFNGFLEYDEQDKQLIDESGLNQTLVAAEGDLEPAKEGGT